jgi:DNA-binding MarR family transcriptional regulator
MHDTTATGMIERCACHRLRMAARAVTRSYDAALRPLGLRATQISVLAAVAARGAVSIAELARAVGMDRSTLKRNLGPLEAEGLLALGDEGWRRRRTLSITPQGRARIEQAFPLWEQAQKRLRRQLGKDGWDDVQRSVDQVLRSAERNTHAGDRKP